MTKQKVGMGRALSLFFKNYFNFSGRSSRPEYWYVFIWYVIVVFTMMSTVLMTLATKFQAGVKPSMSLFLGVGAPVIALLVIVLACIIPWIALCVRRYRDAGVNPWWLIITLGVPSILGNANEWGIGTLGNTLALVAGVLQIVNIVITVRKSQPVVD